MEDITRQIERAFAARAHPGEENITRCGYDKKNGGEYDGPCGECQRMTDFFRGKAWRELSARDLRTRGDADSLFTVEAYCYYLPVYLIAAVRDRKTLDVCVDHLTYRFGPKTEDAHGQDRLSAVFGALSDIELHAILQYFRYSHALERDFDGYCERSISNVERELSQRPNSAMQPTAKSGG